MLILDSISQVRDGQIELPFYHKGHLSLKSGTRVTLCLIPEVADPSFARMTEMIVSPIRFRSWRHLWRINAVFRERQGVVNKLLTLVRDANLNVLFEESSSVQNRYLHEVELICDASAANPTGDAEEEEARLNALRRRIAAILIDELDIRRSALRLGVQRMDGTFTAWQRFQEASRRNESGTVRSNTTIRNGNLLLPPEILSAVPREGDLRALLVSDTKERILRVFFPGAHEHFTYVRVSHLDSVGALADITRRLAHDFDIITSLTRVKAQGDENHLELLLYARELPREEDEVARRELIESHLSHPDLSVLNLRISYPRSVESAVETGVGPRSAARSAAAERQAIDPAIRKLSTAEILRTRLKDYSVREVNTPGFEESELIKRRLGILQRLAAEEGGGEILPRVFLSYDFDREDLFENVESLCSELEMMLIAGRNPTESRVFRQAIINRVLDSDCFLGVWTATKNGMSPWFLWEYGVAQAVAKPCQLLIHEEADAKASIRITPEQHHVRFRGQEFRARAREALALLRSDIRKRTLRGFSQT